MIKAKIEQSNIDMDTFGGLSLIQPLLSKFKLPIHFYDERGKTGDANVLLSMLGLLCTGKSSYADINLFRKSRLFKFAMGINQIPTEVSLRQNLDRLAKKNSTFEALDALNLSFLRTMDFSAIACKSANYFPLDIDVTPLDNSKSKKEGVSCTYKLFDGYAPMMAYLGNEGYQINSEFREGKQHCQNGTPEFLKGVISRAKSVLSQDSRILIRMDGGNHSGDNFEVMNQDRVYWIVKRNLRKEPKEYWLETAKALGDCISDEGGKRIYVGIVSHAAEQSGETSVPTDIVFKVTETYAEPNGQIRAAFEIEIDVETYASNLPESPLDIIELYHNHATSEQFHSEIKTDMGVEKLPSGKLATNSLVFELTKIAYNLLRRIGVDMVEFAAESIQKKGVMRRRIRTVFQEIIYTACQFVMKGRRVKIRFGRSCESFRAIRQLYEAYQ